MCTSQHLRPYIEGKRTVPETSCYIQFLETNLYITFGTALAAFYIPVTVRRFAFSFLPSAFLCYPLPNRWRLPAIHHFRRFYPDSYPYYPCLVLPFPSPDLHSDAFSRSHPPSFMFHASLLDAVRIFFLSLSLSRSFLLSPSSFSFSRFTTTPLRCLPFLPCLFVGGVGERESGSLLP